MNALLERIRAIVDPLVIRLRESTGLLLLAIGAALGLGALAGRLAAPSAPPPVAAPPPPPATKATDFESLVGAESPFETSRQGEQKRLVALQNTLAAAIAGFEGVERATVFIAPRPTTLGLGASAATRTASVHLTMEAGRRLDDGQVEAIAKLVAGAETGLRPEAVAIVDGSGPRAAAARAFDAAAVERIVRERLALLLPDGTVPEVSVASRADGDAATAIDVAIAIPNAYFVAAQALAGDGPESLSDFRAAESERLALSTRRSLEATIDPATGRVASCRVDWAFGAAAEPSAADGSALVRPFVLAGLGLALVLAFVLAFVGTLGVPRWRARRRAAVADRVTAELVESKPLGPAVEDAFPRDPEEAARAIDRWVRGGAA
jgi:hypothetical protein